MKTKTVQLIDPPSGWQYGFPKILPDNCWEDETFSLSEWLEDQGYPLDMIDLALKYSRYWNEKIPVDDSYIKS